MWLFYPWNLPWCNFIWFVWVLCSDFETSISSWGKAWIWLRESMEYALRLNLLVPEVIGCGCMCPNLLKTHLSNTSCMFSFIILEWSWSRAPRTSFHSREHQSLDLLHSVKMHHRKDEWFSDILNEASLHFLVLDWFSVLKCLTDVILQEIQNVAKGLGLTVELEHQNPTREYVSSSYLCSGF